MSAVDQVLRRFAEQGRRQYFGEPVSTAEHSLQTAALAERAGASEALIAAALLHDLGHLLHEEGEDCAGRGIDDRHEALGADWLEPRFGPAVAGPVRLHVEAKRFLCAVDGRYRARLSEASIQSLGLQGGPLEPDAAEAFRALAWADEARRLRRWDDAAKVPDARTPALESYRPLLERLCRET